MQWDGDGRHELTKSQLLLKQMVLNIRCLCLPAQTMNDSWFDFLAAEVWPGNVHWLNSTGRGLEPTQQITEAASSINLAITRLSPL